MGGGGRGGAGKKFPRGQGPIGFVRAGSTQQQPGMPMGQPGMSMGQPGMPVGQVPRVDPVLMNALNVHPGAAGSTNMVCV